MSVKNQFIKNKVNNVTNQKKELNHKIAVIVLSVLMIFWTVASISSVYLVCDKFLPKQDTVTACADEVVYNDSYFSSSAFTYGVLSSTWVYDFVDPVSISGYYGIPSFLNSQTSPPYYWYNPYFQFDFGVTNNGIPFFSPFISLYQYGGLSVISDYYYYSNNSFNTFNYSIYSRPSCVLPLSDIVRENYFSGPEDPIFITSQYQICYCESFLMDSWWFVVGCSLDFNFNPYKVVIKSLDFNDYGVTFVHYYDSNNEFLWFMTYFESSDSLMVSNRTYYFENALSNEYNTGLADGYQNGYNSATNHFNDSLTDIQDQAYQRGYNVGDSAGYSRGYAQGSEDAGNYTFLSLLGSVIDAPVQAITGLFNFEFLGVNMLDFFFGVLTLMLVIFVVRLCLGG